MRLHELDLRPRKAGTYEFDVAAIDHRVGAFALHVEVIDGVCDYEIRPGTGGEALDALSRRYRSVHGTTGWWSTAGPQTFWGTRAEGAFAGWIAEFRRRAAHDPDNLLGVPRR